MNPELYRAATSGNIDLFSQKDSNFFIQKTLEKNSALHLAVKFNQEQFVRKIIDFRPQLLCQANSKGDTPLHIAARVGCLDIAKLLTSDKSREVEAYKELLRMVNLEEDTALHDAVRNGHFEIVKLLIQEDRELTKLINKNGESPLFLAVDRRRFSMACHILKAAPECSYRGRNKMNVLHAAVIRHHSNILFDVWAWFLDNPMILKPIIFIYILTSIKLAWTRLKEELATCGPRTAEADFMSEFIQRHPTAITEADEFGWTPIHYAAYLCHKEAVQLLLKNAGHVSHEPQEPHVAYKKDKEGMSTLHIAAKEGHVSVMRQLIKSFPDTCELLDDRGRTAFHVAVESGKASVVRYVLKTPGLEGLINEQDKEGNTPLHLAAVHGHHNILYMLADDSRVDKDAMNKEGFSAIEIILSKTELRNFQKARIRIKLEQAGAPPREKGVVIREKKKNDEMKEQPQRIESKKELVGDEEIKGTALDSKREPLHRMEMKYSTLHWTGDLAENTDSKIHYLKNVANTHLLVATIIATVTFAAGFTMPGGYENEGIDQGMAILSRKSVFRVFLIVDTIAFCCSAASMLIHFWASMHKRYKSLLYFINFAAALTYFSIIGMVIAFISGTYVVLAGSSSGLATANLAFGCCFYMVFCIWFFG